MNKMIKGSLAGATGIAVLVGGFGTYALWSDNATLEDSSITSGELSVVANNDIAWDDASIAGANDWDYAGDSLMVPGDVVTRTQTFTFDSAGENLTGRITFDLTMPPGAGAVEPAKASTGVGDLADLFNIDVTVAGTVVDSTNESDGCWNFAADDLASEIVTTTVEYELAADHTDLQNATASIPDATFVVEQGVSC